MNKAMIMIPTTILSLAAGGCASFLSSAPPASYDDMTTYRRPFDMRQEAPRVPTYVPAPPPPSLAGAQSVGLRPEVPLQRPLPVDEPIELESNEPTSSPAEILEQAREQATQRPAPKGFLNAVQIYQFEPGAVYEVFAAPTFVTMLHLRPGEELTHVAAGDTSRWLIDVVAAGDADAPVNGLRSGQTQPGHERISVLVKPRLPGLQTNMIISTNERIYLIDLKSHEQTYHSAVEWTYPRPMNVIVPVSRPRPAASFVPQPERRNYVYSLQAPPNGLPPWAPQTVYDDGHRVYIEFPPSINDHERPPLFLLDSDGIARMVNYRTEGNRYVVDRLFDRGALRIGGERVVIHRTLLRPATPRHPSRASIHPE